MQDDTAMNPIQQIIDSVDDALVRIKQDLGLSDLKEEDLTIHSWPQVWSSTACGFGGIAGQALTTAQTVIIVASEKEDYVYHNGRFAYKFYENGRMVPIISDFVAKQAFPGLQDVMRGNSKLDYDIPQIK